MKLRKLGDKLETIGFKNLYNLEGGLTAWEKAGKPVEKPEAKKDGEKP